MSGKRDSLTRWLLALSLIALVITTILFAGVAFASHPMGADYAGLPDQIRSHKTNPNNMPPPCPFPYHYLEPEAGGPCNGCTVHVGDRFVLDMMIHSNLNDVYGQQAYLTFTHSLLQNVRVTDTNCTLTNTVTGDMATFDAILQNEVCNGPEPCVFRGIAREPGSLAFASGALSTCEIGCGGDFRVARIGLCAVAPGMAVLHWQFSPPTRHTDIGSSSSGQMNPVSPEICYTDYVINIVP